VFAPKSEPPGISDPGLTNWKAPALGLALCPTALEGAFRKLVPVPVPPPRTCAKAALGEASTKMSIKGKIIFALIGSLRCSEIRVSVTDEKSITW
jgi:hypothetical protein